MREREREREREKKNLGKENMLLTQEGEWNGTERGRGEGRTEEGVSEGKEGKEGKASVVWRYLPMKADGMEVRKSFWLRMGTPVSGSCISLTKASI